MSRKVFAKNQRLLTPKAFQRVFDKTQCKISNKHFLILASWGNDNFPRLGLVIGKKNVRLAVRRNRIKRVVRESFRRHQYVIPAMDIIFLARRHLDEQNSGSLQDMLERAWRELSQKIERTEHHGR